MNLALEVSKLVSLAKKAIYHIGRIFRFFHRMLFLFLESALINEVFFIRNSFSTPTFSYPTPTSSRTKSYLLDNKEIPPKMLEAKKQTIKRRNNNSFNIFYKSSCYLQ